MIRLGIVGTGGMANAHADNFSKIRGVQLAAACDVVPERAQAFAQKWKIKRVYTDPVEMVAAGGLDAVAVVTVDSAHAPVTLAAIGAGLHVLCEKPLATSLDDAKQMRDAANAKGIIHMVNFSYRNSSALNHAAAVIASGKIGDLRHVESSYLQAWLVSRKWGNWRENPGLLWRLSKAHGSMGDLGDIGVHLYDATSLLCGPITEIDARLQVFDKHVEGNRIGEYVFDANDSFVAHVAFQNGAIGVVHSTRWAVGNTNSLRFRVWGTEGAIEVDLDKSYGEYKICTGKKGMLNAEWKTVTCKPTPSVYQRFINCIKKGANEPNNFENGARVQAYLHASFESDRLKRSVQVEI